jgi:quercetin dioxygenase-like cupin family protein
MRKEEEMAKRILVSDLKGGESATLFEGRDHGSTVSCFLIHNSPGEGPGLHRHPYEETFIVQEGSATFTVEGETIEAGAGHIVIVPARAAHGFVNSGEGILRQVTIHPSDHVIQEWLEE